MIYLHIGRAKSGSTAVQRFLAANRAVLRDQGFNYPKPQKNKWAHHEVVTALGRRMRPLLRPKIADLDIFRQTLRAAPNTIVSSEAFPQLDPAKIVDLFPPGETTVIVYVREQLDYAVSAYAQAVQGRGDTQTFEKFVGKRHPSWNYGEFLDKWSNVYGPEYMRARIYDRSLLVDGDVCKDFLSILGVPWRDSFVEPAIDPNASLSYLLVLTKRLLNRLMAERDHHAWGPERGIWNKIARLDRSKQKKVPVEPELAAQVRKRWRPSNAYVSSKYFGSDKDVFSYRDFSAYEPFKKADVLRVLEQLELKLPPAVRLLEEAVQKGEFVNELPQHEQQLAITFRELLVV
jgi:hypothetical protein